MRMVILVIALALTVASCSGVVRKPDSSEARPGDTDAMLWERTEEQVMKGLLAPEHLGLWIDMVKQEERYRSIFLDANSNFRQDRIPRLKLYRAKSLVDSSEQAATERLKSLGSEIRREEILVVQRDLGDMYVGGLWVPGVGYIGEVWAPVYGLPFDESGNAGGIIARFMDFKTPLQSLPYGAQNTELYWARISENHFSVLIPEKNSVGKIIGFLDSRTARSYAVTYGVISASSSQSADRFGADFDGLPLLLEGQRIQLVRKED